MQQTQKRGPGRPKGSKNKATKPPIQWSLVSLDEAYFQRPRAEFPPPRYLVRSDQRRGRVAVYDLEAEGKAKGAAEYPLERWLAPGEMVAAGIIRDGGQPVPVYGPTPDADKADA